MLNLLEGMMTEEDFLQHMSTLSDDELEHAGVKGMKWGVIRDRAKTGDQKAQKLLAKGDKKWLKENQSFKQRIAVHNNMAQKFNSKIDGINQKYAKVDVSKPGPATTRYHKEVGDLQKKSWLSAIDEVMGTSPSGTYKADVTADGTIAIYDLSGDN